MNIAITGEGIVSAIGNNKEEVLLSLRKRQSGIGRIKYLRTIHEELPVGEVDMSNEEMRSLLGISLNGIVSRTTMMGILAVRQALDDAHIPTGKRVILVSGTTVGGMDVTERCFKDINADVLRQHDGGNCTKAIARYFGGLFDDVTTISTACSSAANAIMLGARLIKEGLADIVVAGGTEALSKFHLNGFNSLMILDHERCRPFDADRNGLNLGEGAAYLVLESDDCAKGRNIHAWLTGYGNACDAFHQAATSANGDGATIAMTEALEEAGLAPSDIQYVNAHGTGTVNNDESESNALKQVFGDSLPLVSSTKGFTGHATSAAGSIEAVICLLAMRHNFVPANIGWSTPMSGGIVPTLGAENTSLEHVMCNAFGFGGNDTSLIFSKTPVERKGAAADHRAGSDPVEVSRVELSTEEDLRELREYVKPLEARRMGKLMRGAFLSSKKALEAAGIETPDAIIIGTAYGCLENSEKLLVQIIEEGETAVKPTLFMQSTHNTIAGDLAIRMKCKGYNCTYTQCDRSLDWALLDARMLLKSGKCKNVLVGLHDETAPIFAEIMGDGYDVKYVKSIAIVLTCGEL